VIDTTMIEAAVRAIVAAEDAALEARAQVNESYYGSGQKLVSFQELESAVLGVHAKDAEIIARRAELDALVNGKPKRKRAKKAKTEEKPAPRRALGRKGLPKGEPVGGVA